MIARCSIVRIRSIHSATNILSKFKFNDEQTMKILNVVNNSNVQDLTTRFVISETRAKRLHARRQQSGKEVDSIDEMLNISGFNANALNQFCQSILNEGNCIEIGNENLIKKPRTRSFTYPPMSDRLVKHIHSFTSIHCAMTGLSWSTFQISPNEITKMTHWDYRPLPEEKLKLYHLAAFMTNGMKTVPQSDFYVFENPNSTSSGSTSKMNLNLQISQMIGMATVIAAQKNTLSSDPAKAMNVAYLRKFLFARLFKLYIGTERISTTNYVDDLVRMSNVSKLMDENCQTLVDVDHNLKSMYNKSEYLHKDFLGCSFLLGLAFLRLSLLKCPKSIKLVGP